MDVTRITALRFALEFPLGPKTLWRIAVVEKLLLLVGLGLSARLPLSAYAQENGTAVRTIEGAESGVHADILSLKRTP